MSNPKLKGQRLGQVVYNALHKGNHTSDSMDCAARIAERLATISDEDLVKLINDYLKEQ